MIHHLSFLFGASVNYFIPQEFCSEHYAKVDDVIRFIKRLGRGCTLSKTDVRSAFRIIPIHSSDYHLRESIQWEGNYYVDCCLPMGCASSCRTFNEALNTAKDWVAGNKLAITKHLTYFERLSDSEKSHEACDASLQRFLHFFVTTLVFPWLQINRRP